MSSEYWDVLVIGAGAAGLGAARELARHERSVLVLEARDRVGGRIWTLHEPHAGVPIELGAEFIHGEGRETRQLLEASGRAAMDMRGEHWSLHHGKLQHVSDDLFGEIQEAMAAADLERADDVSLADFLAHGAQLSAEAADLARSMAEGFDAADTHRVSARSIASEWASGGMLDAAQYRPVSGYGSVLAALAGSLDRERVKLQLHTTVQHVHWSRGTVEVAGQWLGEPFRVRARKAIVTLPLGVLKVAAGAPGSVLFTPELDDKRAALQGLHFGAVLKVILRFRQAFWEEVDGGRYRDAAFLHAPGPSFPTFWTTLPLRAPVLTAWMGGPAAERLSGESDARIVRAALDSLIALFPQHGARHLQLEAAHLHNWQRDVHARGAYSYLGVGADGARAALAAPLLDTLYFAGEATDVQGGATTVNGALNSGIRAARELLRG